MAGDKDALFSGEFTSARSHFDAQTSEGDRLVTEQDKCLYSLCRPQRLLEGKEYGYIVDYANVLGELDKALTAYDALAGFDGDDLADFLISINEQVSQLPQHHSELWDLFKEIKNSRDEEQYEVLMTAPSP